MFGKINDAYDVVKNGLEVEIALATADQKEKLADAKIALAELKDLIADLKDENRGLKERLDQKQGYKLAHGVYWRTDDSDLVQPFCPSCYAKGQELPLQPYQQNTRETTFSCPTCKAAFNPYDYHESAVVVPQWQEF